MEKLKNFSAHPSKTHTFVSIAILPISFALILLSLQMGIFRWQGLDKISVNIYLLALLVSLYIFIRQPKDTRMWTSLITLLVILVAFLEESEFLTEIWNLEDYVDIRIIPAFTKPYFEELGKPNFHRHSFHNMLQHILLPWFQANKVDSLVAQAARQLSQLSGIAVLYLVSFRINLFSERKWTSAYNFNIALLLNGILAIVHLLILPTDPKNNWLLGISLTRFAIVFAILLFSLHPLIFVGIKESKLLERPRLRNVFDKLLSRQNRYLLLAAMLILLFLLLRFLFILITTLNPISHEIAQRLLPILGFFIGANILLIMLLMSLSKIFSLTVADYWTSFKRLLTNFPSLIYIISYLIIATALAQFFDFGLLFADAEESRQIAEEGLELVGGIQLIIAAALSSYREKKSGP